MPRRRTPLKITDPTPAPVTDLKALPLILTVEEVGAIYRLNPGTIKNMARAGTFRPMPFEKYPYRWLREDVARDLTRKRELRKRAHGFAAKRPAAVNE